jgi:hypothetical protein
VNAKAKDGNTDARAHSRADLGEFGREFMRDIEQIITSVERLYPGVEVRQLKVSHPGVDDDGIWFFKHPSSDLEIQIESSNGMCPFLIETDENPARIIAGTVEETVEALAGLLHR